jgi:hypothetical protein
MGSERRTKKGTISIDCSFSRVIGGLAVYLGDLCTSRQEKAIIAQFDHGWQGVFIAAQAGVGGHRLHTHDAQDQRHQL